MEKIFYPAQRSDYRSGIFNGIACFFGLTFGVLCAIIYLSRNDEKPHLLRHRQTTPGHSFKPHAIAKWDSNHTVADRLRKEIRILCWIMTGPMNHRTKAQHVRHTWGKHCNTLLFMTSNEDPDLPNSIPLVVDEGRDNLWAKTKKAFEYVYENHLDDADWFMKADDDTYVVMENLRRMLHTYTPDTPIYFGHKFRLPSSDAPVYMSGGSGYVLSKEALRRLVNVGIPDATICCPSNGGAEDLEMGRCLAKLNVLAGDSRDEMGRNRFFALPMEYTILPNEDKGFWYNQYEMYHQVLGVQGVSPSSISFHYTDPHWMYIMDYLLYGVQTYGRTQLPMCIDEMQFTYEQVKEELAVYDKDCRNPAEIGDRRR